MGKTWIVEQYAMRKDSVAGWDVDDGSANELGKFETLQEAREFYDAFDIEEDFRKIMDSSHTGAMRNRGYQLVLSEHDGSEDAVDEWATLNAKSFTYDDLDASE